MGPSEIIGIAGILVAIGTYFSGVRHGRRQEHARFEHDRDLERERRLHELAGKVADEYVGMSRRNYDRGPHAMATLGLDQLGSDALIREAIHEMYVRSGSDPWAGQGGHVDDLDLVAFFRHVREKKVDFSHTQVEKVAQEVRAASGAKGRKAV
ncbi:MAG: hypothetical protein F9K13_10660 [Candidatus Methylomirabilis oxygeniifera]|nr:MAG: hypothetical protein F9K13_10660 [Candidatus Methylomirabilis oxyfera]